MIMRLFECKHKSKPYYVHLEIYDNNNKLIYKELLD
jgi:hypothetical protein